MNTHTPEPWFCHQHASDGSSCILDKLPESGPYHGTVIVTPGTNINAREDHKRIVACVNALAGINPEAVPDMLEALRKLADYVQTKFENPLNFTSSVVLEARDAIAKATGAK